MIVWADILRYANEGNPAPSRRVEKTDAAWQSILTAEQYRITRAKGTEKRNSGALCQVFEPGQYHCVLYSESIKLNNNHD